jgi:hypothetical protein
VRGDEENVVVVIEAGSIGQAIALDVVVRKHVLWADARRDNALSICVRPKGL